MDERRPLLQREATDDIPSSANTKQHIVDFDSNGDSANPLEWPKLFRWGIVLLLASMALTTTFACIGIVPVAGMVIDDLGNGQSDRSASVLFVTIWELGEAAGPLFIAPLSERYGRYRVFNACNVLFILGLVVTALSQNVGLVIFARFATGCAVAANVLNPAVIADLFPPDQRGSAMSAIFLAPLLGGAVGPAVAGAIAQTTGWREIIWAAVALAAVCETIFLTLFQETYPVRILRLRAAKLRRETRDESFVAVYDAERDKKQPGLLVSMITPIKVFASSVVLQILSLWGALVFSFFYVMSTTLPDLLQEVYHFDPALRGTAFLSFSIGSVSGIVLCNLVVDRLYIHLRDRRGAKIYPEARLPLPIIGAFLLPLGVAFYGFAPEFHWPVWTLLLAVVVLGFLVIICLVPMMTYVTDAFGISSASALTAVLISRCLAGTFLPLLTAPLTDALGYGNGFLVLAGACMVLAPVPVVVMRYGLRWRGQSKYSVVE